MRRLLLGGRGESVGGVGAADAGCVHLREEGTPREGEIEVTKATHLPFYTATVFYFNLYMNIK